MKFQKNQFIKVFIFVFLSLFLTTAFVYSAVNPFLKSNPAAQKTSSSKKNQKEDSQEKSQTKIKQSQIKKNSDEPKKLSLFMRKLLHFQRKMRERVSLEIEDLKDNNNFSTFFWILLLSFFYGVIHAIGPGHGKGVITGWVLSSPKNFKTVTLASSLAALFHALSATLLVSGSYLIVKQFVSSGTQKVEASLQIGAGILLLAIGIYSLLHFIIGKIKKGKHHPGSEEELLKKAMNKKAHASAWTIALSIGIVPCPVSSVILIFSLTMGLIWQGFVFVIAFALGMALTIFCFAVIVWFFRNKSTKLHSNKMHWVIENIFPVFGVFFFFVSGLFILLPYLV